MLSFGGKKVQGSNVVPVSKTEFGLILGATFTLSYPVLTMCNVHSLGFMTLYKSCFISGNLEQIYSLRIPKL